MSMAEIGKKIRKLRKFRGMSKFELCGGICVVDLLNAIEKGESRASLKIFNAIMERLGEDPLMYYADALPNLNLFTSDLNDRIEKLLLKKDEESNLEAERLISEGEREKFTKNEQGMFDMQLLQMNKAFLYFNRNEYKAAYECAVDALLIFYNDFHVDEISQYWFSPLELDLLNIMAMSQFYFVSPEKAYEMFLQILDSFKNCYKNEELTRKQHIRILYNLSVIYGMQKEYEKCIPVCDEGIKLCRVESNLRFLPLILFSKGCALLYLGDIEQGKQIMAKALAAFYVGNNGKEIPMMEPFLKDEFNITLPELKNIINFQI